MSLMKVVTGTQLEVQMVETSGTPSGTFFLGFVEGKGGDDAVTRLRETMHRERELSFHERVLLDIGRPLD